jgi:hypothetical protein
MARLFWGEASTPQAFGNPRLAAAGYLSDPSGLESMVSNIFLPRSFQPISDLSVSLLYLSLSCPVRSNDLAD